MPYLYKDIYRFAAEYFSAQQANADETKALPVKMLVRQLELHIDWLQSVRIYPIGSTSPEDKVWGAYERIADQNAEYETLDTHNVYIMHGDWQNLCTKRFVCCKELLHVFDHKSAQVSSDAAYSALKNEIEDYQAIETRPFEMSDPMKSENQAQWKALILLCPMGEREKVMSTADSDYAIALRYRIPETLIETIKSDSYLNAYKAFIETE